MPTSSFTPLAETFYTHNGNLSDKWEHYIDVYDAELARFVARGEPVRLLEIGVQNGGSLEIWSKYLPAGSSVVGIDTDPACARLSRGETIRVVVANACDPDEIGKALGDARFEIVIDDGSHHSKDIISAFEIHFDRLAPGGLYVIEDLHCSYLPSHGGGFRNPEAAIEWLKRLVDAVNADHFLQAVPAPGDSPRLWRWGRQISRIAFFDSMVVIEKRGTEKLRPYKRVITGSAAPVSDLPGDLIQLPPAQLRRLGISRSAADLVVPAVIESVAAAKEEAGALRAALAHAKASISCTEAAAKEEIEKCKADMARSGSMARAQLEALRAALARMEQRCESERTRITEAEMLTQAEEARAELAESHLRVTEEQAGAAAIRAADAEALARALYSSSVWQATWPIRIIGQRLPPPARRWARRAAKVGWWTITGTLVRHLRSRADQAGVETSHSKTIGSAPSLQALPGIPKNRGASMPDGAPTEEPTLATSSPSLERVYEEFLKARAPGSDLLRLQRRVAMGFLVRPKFSVLVPVFRTPAPIFRDMVESVRTQSYNLWEVCLAIVDTGADAAPLIEIARDAGTLDPRIRFKVVPQNWGISGNSNIALEMAQGDWCVLLDHDDLLSPEALFQMARALNADPGADFLYSDKDMVDRKGERHCQPLFKPAWSPEIMLNANYLTHLCALRTTKLRAIGGWDPDTDGAQDWDLFLRFISAGARVHHIPSVLYHWRQIETSVASGGLDAKPYAALGQLRALAKYLPVAGWPNAAPQFQGDYIRIRWSGDPPPTTVIVVGGMPKSQQMALSCCPAVEVLVADGSPNAEQLDGLVSEARGEIIVLIDAGFEPNENEWIRELVIPLLNPAISLVAGRVLDPARRIQDYGVVFQGGVAHPVFRGVSEDYCGPAGCACWYRNASAAAGGAIAFRRSLWKEVGGFRPFAQAGRIDLAFTLEAGKRGPGRLMLNPFAQFTATTGLCSFERNANAPLSPQIVRATLPDGDPYINPNLGAAGATPRLRLAGKRGAPPPGHDFGAEGRYVAGAYSVTRADIVRSLEACAAIPRTELHRMLWIIPDFEVPFYGGIHSILRTAEHMRIKHGVDQAFAVMGTPHRPATLVARIARAFPALAANSELATFSSPDEPPSLGEFEAAACTLWTTAYALLRMQNVGRKFYFLQDWEPLFYPAGTVSEAVEATYRFGFHALCNTPSLAASYKELGGQADFFVPAVDPALFHSQGRRAREKEDPFVLFWYARPGTPRNCFEALAAGATELKRRYAKTIEIVSAGADWDPSRYGLEKVVHNLGLLHYTETGALYRAADAGLVAMATRHPSYLPFELMASGAVVVANRNPYTAWLLRDGENSLLCEMTREDVAETVGRLIEDPDLRNTLARTAAAQIAKDHSDWAASCESIYDIVRKATEDPRDARIG